jgi:hypothetical protein
LSFLVGEPEVADKSSLGKPNWLRIKGACSRPELIGGVNSVLSVDIVIASDGRCKVIMQPNRTFYLRIEWEGL